MKRTMLFLLVLLLAGCGPVKPATHDLVVQTYELTGRPDPEQRTFTSVDGKEFSSADYDAVTLPPSNQQADVIPLSYMIPLNGSAIIAQEYSEACGDTACITVTKDGQEIFRTDAGGISPVEPLRGLWTYDNHWVMETNNFLDAAPFNGQIFEDGESLRDKLGYEETFGFQTIGGRPFYFFKRDGKINAWYDGKEITLDFDDVPHYLCCGDSGLNPYAGTDSVFFFGTRGGTWTFVKIGTQEFFKQ